MKTLSLQFLLIAFVYIIAPAARATGWTSSGGESLKDKINPWFLHNTPRVQYCILHDARNFGQPYEQVRKRVRYILNVWKLQIGNLEIRPISGPDNGTPNIRIGTQEFIESSCDQADLKFQFGVLTGEQFSKLGDPTKYIGVTVRTHYDRENLRAKGFIYFSPEQGPLKLNKEGLIENPWSRSGGAYLLLALLHETGHIFGFQHDKSLPIMEESYLENVLAKGNFEHDNDDNWVADIEKNHLLKKINFFRVDAKNDVPIYRGCASSAQSGSQPISKEPIPLAIPSLDYGSVFEKYAGITTKPDGGMSYCYRMTTKNSKLVFEVTQKNEGQNEVVIGRAENLLRHDSMDDRVAIVKIWLSKKQNLIDLSSVKFYLEKQLDLGYMQSASLFKGTYKIMRNNVEHPFFISAKCFGHMRFGGTLDNVYYMDLLEGF
jgi:hypothetical protein